MKTFKIWYLYMVQWCEKKRYNYAYICIKRLSKDKQDKWIC